MPSLLCEKKFNQNVCTSEIAKDVFSCRIYVHLDSDYRNQHMKTKSLKHPLRTLAKAPTGIQGLDEITNGGFPNGRTTLVCGTPGCGKTLLAMEFLIHGVMKFKESGVFLAFEESAEELTQNVRSLGYDLNDLVRRKKLIIDYIPIEATEFEETGEYDLEGLFVRLGHSIDSIGAKRVALDTIEALFGGLSNEAILRSELRRLFQWLKTKHVTSIVTGERGEKSLTRQGLEEYVSDCVILLDHRIREQTSTRRLRIVKYRGTTHGNNEYPFLIEKDGLCVFPETSLKLNHEASNETISTGVPSLDTMFLDGGIYRGSTILISGTAGIGKTSLASHFVHASCQRGEQSLYLQFEESEHQLIRNMRSIGLDLKKWIKKDLLRFQASRPSLVGLEKHLMNMYQSILSLKPQLVVMDPINDFISIGSQQEVKSLMLRMLNLLKSQQITVIFTYLSHVEEENERTNLGISSLADTWISLANLESHGERNRNLFILKSRGSAHSNQLREFIFSPHGIQLKEAYLGPYGVLTGTARLTQEAHEQAEAQKREEELQYFDRLLNQKRQGFEHQMASLRIKFEEEEAILRRQIQARQVQTE